MPENGSASANSIVRKARQRVKFRTVKWALGLIFSLMFFAAAGGFAWGMWDEVGTAPEKYAALKARDDAEFASAWSVRAANYIAGLQTKGPGPDTDTLARRDREPFHRLPKPDTPRTAPEVDPKHTEPVKPPPEHTDPKHTDPVKPPPEHTDPKHTEPAKPPTQKPAPIAAEPRLDKTTNELLQKAHRAFDTAWKYHLKARPDAPSRGRDAANKKAIKYLEESRKYYLAVLKRKIPPDIRKRIENRVVPLQRMLYWAYKHSRIR